MRGQSTESDLISVSDTAARLGICEDTVRRWIASGALPATKIGGRVLIGRSAVDALVAKANGAPVADLGTTNARVTDVHTMSSTNRGGSR